MYSLDTSLNLVWVAICVAALGWCFWSDRRRRGSRWIRSRRFASLFVVALALFPSVSVSDDEVNFWFLFTPAGHRSGAGVPIEETKERAAQHLARVLDSLEHFQVAGVWTFTLTLFFLSFVLITVPIAGERFRISSAGRAPPAF